MPLSPLERIEAAWVRFLKRIHNIKKRLHIISERSEIHESKTEIEKLHSGIKET